LYQCPVGYSGSREPINGWIIYKSN
jgi:hypothetical protein